MEAAGAGAAIIHLHARDPIDGRPSPSADAYMRSLTEIVQSTQAVINITKSDFIYIAKADEYQCPAGQRASFGTLERNGLQARLYWTSACPSCPLKKQCTTGDYRRIRRWEHEEIFERVQERLDRKPVAMTL